MSYTITSSTTTTFGIEVTFAPFGLIDIAVIGTGLTYDAITLLPSGGTLSHVDVELSTGSFSLVNFAETDIATLAGYDFNVTDQNDIPVFLSQFPGLEIQLNEGQSFYWTTYFDTNDRIFGSAEADTIFAGNGKDFVQGGLGDDSLYGDDGIDRLFGQAGADDLIGGDHDDHLFGGRGHDELFGDVQPWYSYSLNGDGGQDRLFGGSGRDSLYGGELDDFAHGGTGRDYLDGGSGNDVLRGGAQGDRVSGGQGDDILRGEDGADSLFGGGGYYYGRSDETDNDKLFGGAGGDLLFGDGGDDMLFGGSGSDYLAGGPGSDSVFGGLGDDVLLTFSDRFIGKEIGLPSEDTEPMSEYTGGSGTDVFIFATASEGQTVIKDFTDGEDLLQLQDVFVESPTYVRTGRAQYKQFLENATDTEAGVLYAASGGEVLIEGITLDDLSGADFQLALGNGGFFIT